MTNATLLVLTYGALPKREFFHLHCERRGIATADVADIYKLLRNSIAQSGANPVALMVLNSLGFTWSKPSCCGGPICRCVEAVEMNDAALGVAAALGVES